MARAVLGIVPIVRIAEVCRRETGTLMAVLLQAALLMLVWATGWFALSLALSRNDVADVAWGLGFITLAWWALLRDGSLEARSILLAALVTIWGLRLAVHIGRRNLAPGHKEDPRYAAWRREWGRWFLPRSFLQVFVLQAALALLVSAPLLVVAASPGGALGLIDLLGAAIWLLGITIETVADAQLTRHLAAAENRGRPLASGLWALSRHPNYFGEALAWWGLGVVALAVPGGYLGLLGPLTITLLLRFVSGVPMLEARHTGEPAWEEYRARVPVFAPVPRKSR